MFRDKDEIFYALSDTQLLALLTKHEAGGEIKEGQIAVMCVIKNRVVEGGYFIDSSLLRNGLSNYKCIIMKNVYVSNINRFIYQFSCFNDSDPNRYRMEVEAISGIIPEDLSNLAENVIYGDTIDNTDGSNHYYNPNVVMKEPEWAKNAEFKKMIGNHLFLRI